MMRQTRLPKLLFVSVVCSVLLSGCSALLNEDGLLSQRRWATGDHDTDLAIVALMKGNLDKAEVHTRRALERNPRHPYALMVGAIIYENTGRPHRARQYYEDILAYRPSTLSLFYNLKDLTPISVSDTAHEKIQVLQLKSNPLVWPSVPGQEQTPTFNMSATPAPLARDAERANSRHSASMQQAKAGEVRNFAAREGRLPADAELFGEEDRNAVKRFEIFKRLAEEGLITRDEYLLRRQASIGALLPQTEDPPAAGLGRPVPSVEMVVSRLRALRRAFETRAISAREHAAERSMILDALLPADPAVRANVPLPPSDILTAATTIRRLESLNDMGLITKKELVKESAAIEHMMKFEPKTDKKMPLPLAASRSPRPLVSALTTPTSLALSPNGKTGVHLGSFGSEANAMKAASTYKERFPALSSLSVQTKATVLGADKGTVYRLMFGPLATAQAKSLCATLKKAGQYCVPAGF